MAAMNDDYVTKQDLKEEFAQFRTEFKSDLLAEIVPLLLEFQRNIVSHMDENFATKQDLKETEERLNEKIHDTETRLLRGHEHHARGTEAYLKALDARTMASLVTDAAR